MEQEKATTRRLAQSLHDQLGQSLATLRLLCDLPPTTDEAQQDKLRQRASRLIDHAIGEVRQVLMDLRPPQLDDGGLLPALENELHQRRVTAPAIDLLLEADPALRNQRWPPDVEYAAFMVAREAVANAILHAHPALVRVLVASEAGTLRLEVIDDGCGLPDGQAHSAPGHLGVVGMRERALAIGAGFAVAPVERGGTKVSLTWRPMA
jgi:signal transduction histidine kinase